MMGLNNIELISDRPIETNLREIAYVKKRYPKHAVIASLMVESTREAWHDIVQRSEDAGADGLELNFGCPHGMSERGMGSAVGQVPEYTEMITGWVKEKARTPVLVKLTPNITDIRQIARAAKRAGADGLSAINTLNSITGIDLDTLEPRPNVDGLSSHGGYCGPAVKPIALNMVHQLQNDDASRLPISGIGGIGTWRDAAEFILLGCGTVQVCTAAMHYGYRIVEDMIDGLAELDARERLRSDRGFPRVERAEGHRLESSELKFQDRGAHSRREVHWLRAVLHRVLGRGASVYSFGRRAFHPTGDGSSEPLSHLGDADSQAGSWRRVRCAALAHSARR